MHISECLHVSKNHVLHFFLITTNKTKQKFLHTFVDIAKETAFEKNQTMETQLELELPEVRLKQMTMYL